MPRRYVPTGRRPGRPSLGGAGTLYVRLTPELRAALDRLLESADTAEAELVRSLLRDALRQRGAMP